MLQFAFIIKNMNILKMYLPFEGGTQAISRDLKVRSFGLTAQVTTHYQCDEDFFTKKGHLFSAENIKT